MSTSKSLRIHVASERLPQFTRNGFSVARPSIERRSREGGPSRWHVHSRIQHQAERESAESDNSKRGALSESGKKSGHCQQNHICADFVSKARNSAVSSK
jgi:hypothetical protein